MERRVPILPGGTGFLLLSWPAEGWAHGFAQRYDLPVPLGFFLAGAGAAVALSFLLLAVFGRERPRAADRPAPRLPLPALGRLLSNAWLRTSLQTIAAALLVLIVAAGFFGNQNPYQNIAPTFAWVIWWVGMMFINTLIGDVWALVNPWNAVFVGAKGILRRLKPRARLALERPYPERLGIWPAVVLFLAFAWLELVSGEGESPRTLAVIITVYSLITWAGMFVFGRGTWLNHGEAFTVVFSTFARFAPLAFHAGAPRGGGTRCPHGWETSTGGTVGCAFCFDEAAPANRALVLRPPGAGLLVTRPVSVSLLAMVLSLLATVTFDGVLATPLWTDYYLYFKDLDALRPLWRGPWVPAGSEFHVLATLMFLLFPLLFATIYLCFCRITAAAGGVLTTFEIARNFILTLLPIAIAYHLSHYLTYLVLGGQYIIPALSDPFGIGWDLFGTASYKADIGLIGARFHWYTAVIAIVLGHVIAVYLAHRTATRLVEDRRRAFQSQLPMLALMVGYTMLSLWIISQPTVK